jgi:DNA polymerase-3 subunit delta
MAADFESAIADGPLMPVYVLGGEHPLLYQRALAKLVERVVEPATRAFNYDAFEAKAAGASAILAAARTVPMMAQRRLVVARDTDLLGADDLASLAVYLENPAPWTVLLLHVSKIDGKRKLFQVAKKKGFLHDLPPPRPIGPWIRGEAKRAGAQLEDDAARRLQEIIGEDVSRLATCIEQLALYVGDRKVITAADVDELIAETRERSVFDLTDAIGRGDRERAMRAAARLFAQRESAVGVAMMLARHVRQLGQIRELLAQRASTTQIQEALKLPPFIVNQLIPQARRYAVISLARAVRLVSQADVDLKGPKKGALGERVLVERLVEDLLSLGN